MFEDYLMGNNNHRQVSCRGGTTVAEPRKRICGSGTTEASHGGSNLKEILSIYFKRALYKISQLKNSSRLRRFAFLNGPILVIKARKSIIVPTLGHRSFRKVTSSRLELKLGHCSLLNSKLGSCKRGSIELQLSSDAWHRALLE